MLQEMKIKIEAFLPLMKEIEAMGHNPVEMILIPIDQVTLKTTEIVYQALTRCKEKYPEWYSVMSKKCALQKGISHATKSNRAKLLEMYVL